MSREPEWLSFGGIDLQIRKLRLDPGDIVVIRTKGTFSIDIYNRIRSTMERFFLELGLTNKVVVLDPVVEIGVISVCGDEERCLSNLRKAAALDRMPTYEEIWG